MKIRNISQSILTASLGASLALVGFYFLNDQNSTSPSTNKKTIIQAAPQIHLSKSVPSTLMVEIPSFETAASQSVNSVVHIKTISTGHQNKQSLQDPLQDLFFGRQPRNQQPKKIAGSGSGVIISDDGYIATNNHVIEGATKIEVTLNDKKTYTGTIVGTDPTTDLALIKIKAKNEKSVIKFVNNLKLFGHGYSWGGFESLALHQNLREQGNRSYLKLSKDEHLVRLHIGLEDPDDLIADIKQSMKHIK